MSSLKAPVCPVDALSIGEMKQFTVQGREILLARKQDGFFAIAGTVCEEGDECSDPWRDKDFH